MNGISRLSTMFSGLFSGKGSLNEQLHRRVFESSRPETMWRDIQRLVKRGADVNAASDKGATVLGSICAQGLPEVARHLVEDAGANVNQANSKGTTPVMLAAWAGDAQTMKMLLDHQANAAAKNKDNQDAVYEIVHGRHRESGRNSIQQGECLKLLLAHGATISHADEIFIYHNKPEIEFAIPEIVNAKALVQAAETGNLKKMKELTDAGVHPDAPVHFASNPPLFYAAKNGDLKMIALLRQAGANPREGHPPLLVAAENGQKAAFEALLDMGADPKAVYPGGKTVLDFARESGDPDMEPFIKNLLIERALPPLVLANDLTVKPQLRLKTRGPV